MTSVWTNRGAGEDWSCEPLRELEEAMNASQPAAAAACVGPDGTAATGFWLKRDATRHHPGGRQTSGRATASFDIFDWPRLMLGNGPPVVRARPTLPTSHGRLEVGCAGEERRWICSRNYAANTSSG